MTRNVPFYGNLGVVTVAHFVALALLLSGSFLGGLIAAKPEVFIPVDLQFVAPPAMVREAGKSLAEEPKVTPTGIAVGKTTVKNQKRESGAKKGSTNKYSRVFANAPKGRQPPLSAEMIEKMILAGARPGEINVLPPDDDTLEKMIVQKRFDDAWIQPSKADAGNAVAEAVIRLEADGSVSLRTITRRTGIPAMDDSITQALNAVERIDGLSAEFLARARAITIVFKVE
jgi:hypothetical protein